MSNKYNPTVEIVAFDTKGLQTYNRDFETLKEARQWVKETGLDADFWDRGAEVPGWHFLNVDTLRLLVDGNCLQDWFPKWPKRKSLHMQTLALGSSHMNPTFEGGYMQPGGGKPHNIEGPAPLMPSSPEITLNELVQVSNSYTVVLSDGTVVFVQHGQYHDLFGIQIIEDRPESLALATDTLLWHLYGRETKAQVVAALEVLLNEGATWEPWHITTAIKEAA
jgi:hypothetical protein